MGNKKQNSIKVTNLADLGKERPYAYLTSLMCSQSISEVKIKGKYQLLSSRQSDEKSYSAEFTIKPIQDTRVPILGGILRREIAKYEMDFKCYKEEGVWDDPEKTIYGQISDLISRIGVGNIKTEVKKDEKNDEKIGSLEFTLSKI